MYVRPNPTVCRAIQVRSIAAATFFLVTGCGGAGEKTTAPPRDVTPAITTQPQDVVVAVGQPATFSVVASGTTPLSYQWRRGAAIIPGATAPAYAIANATAEDNGSVFTVTVANRGGTATSRAAALTVNAPPSITRQPTDVVATSGQSATFSVVASGTAPLSLQWLRNGADIPGATGDSYVVTAAPSEDGARFSVRVSNMAGAVTSREATLTVAVPPSITAQPQDLSVSAGQAATFSVVASGTPSPSFQWSRNGVDLPGATSSSYTIPATQRADSGDTFAVLVTSQGGAVSSRAATLRVTGVVVYGLGGFRPDVSSDVADIVGARYRFLVTENQSQALKIVFAWSRAFNPSSSLTYPFESNLYSGGFSQGDGTCATWPLIGTYTEQRASLRLGIADYAYGANAQPGLTTGLRTLDPSGFPTQNYLVDGLPKLYKTDAIGQSNFNSVETLVTIERGAVITDISSYQRCGQPLVPGTYRVWSIRVQPTGMAASSAEVVMPEANARYLSPGEFTNMASEFLNTAGVWTIHYWDFAIERESDPTWHPVTTFLTGAQYDGNTRDFGVRVVTAGTQNHVEISNRSGNTYLRGGIRFTY